MKKITLLTLVLLIGPICLAQWQNLNSGINDTLTDVVFFENQGVVSGENGLYYTLNGGNGSANWQRFEITDNPENAEIYANTRFTSGYSNPYNNDSSFIAYFVGEDIVNNKAVIMSLEMPSLTYSIVQLDFPNSRLNDIKYCKNFARYYAVGDNGLMLHFSSNILFQTIVTNNLDHDFTAISFNTTGYMARIASENKYYRMTTSGHFLTLIDTPDETHNDMTYGTYSVNDKYMRHNYTNKYVYSNYDYGPINGNTIFAYGTRNFVGTDHGIFMSNTGRDVLQWQPSSGTIHTNGFWKTNSSSTLYACGANGAILKNETPTAEAKPYARIDFDGGCASEFSHSIQGVTGDSTSCSWYIDNVLVSSDCESFNYNSFDTAGIYEIKLEVDYNGLITETTKTIHIVDDPEIDKPISILDTILCHEEPIAIEISNSEPDVFYTLHKEGTNAVYGTSEVGNNGTITLNSLPLNETANYYLKSANIFAPSCEKTFTNTFEIIVEQTEANFHTGLINASINEDVPFYQISSEASNYNWTFTNAANTLTSTAENPINTFNTPGIHDVTLTASSANLCVDDITAQSPNIYTEPSEATTCWSYINESEDPNWNGSYTPDISHITEVTGGYLTGGYYRNEVFGSNHGVEFLANDSQGGYLSKHDSKGTLKWLVYTSIASSTSRSSITASVEDQNGDIYISITDRDCLFYDNSGKVIELDKGGSIVKLSSKGELIWHMQVRTFTPTGLTVDMDNNLIIYGAYNIYNDTQHFVYLNDEITDEVGTIIFPDPGFRNCNAIIKSTPEGVILWDNEIFSTSGTFGTDQQTRAIDVDNNNNFYVRGLYKNHMYIYHSGSVNPTYLDFHQNNPAGTIYAHLFKLNSDGALQWVTRSYKTQGNDYSSITENDSRTDASGNTYLTGQSNSNGTNPDHYHNTENADGSIFSSNEAQTYYLKKINSSGITEWIVGANDQGSELTFPRGYKLDLKNDEISVIGTLKTNIDTPEDLLFKSINDANVTASLISNDLFAASYSTDGVLNSVSVFNSIIENPYNTSFSGFINKASGEFYVSTNYGSAAEKNGRIDYLNSDFCATTYTTALSVEEYTNEIKVSAVPNPNNGEFSLIIAKPYLKSEVNIYNTLMQLISTETYNNSSNIPLHIKGNVGVYFVEISIDDIHKKTIKVLVK